MMQTPPAGGHARGGRHAKNPLLLSWHLVPLPAPWLSTTRASLPLALRTPLVLLPPPTSLASAAAATVATGDTLLPAGAALHASAQRAAALPPKKTPVVTP